MAELTIHIGAHRTATTAIQSALKRQAKALKAEGIGLSIPANHRAELTGPLIKCARSPFAVSEDEIAKISTDLNAFVQAYKRVIMSEENLLGRLADTLLRFEFYPNPSETLTVMQELCPITTQGKIVLTIRNRADFYRSLYGYRVGILFFEPFEFYREKLLAIERSWFQVVQELCEAFPQAEIVVVDFDALKLNWDLIFSELGVSEYDQPANSNFSFSNEIIKDLLKTRSKDAPLPVNERGALRKTMKNASYTPFQPWSEADLEHFREEYARDINNIQNQTRARLVGANS